MLNVLKGIQTGYTLYSVNMTGHESGVLKIVLRKIFLKLTLDGVFTRPLLK